jgi:hypothetical protein
MEFLISLAQLTLTMLGPSERAEDLAAPGDCLTNAQVRLAHRVVKLCSSRRPRSAFSDPRMRELSLWLRQELTD